MSTSSTYVYQDPCNEGFEEVNLTGVQRRQTLEKCGYRRRLWTLRPVKYVNVQGVEKIHVFTSLPAKVLTVLLFPINLVVFGLANWREVVRDTSRTLNERKQGAFIECVFRKKAGA